MNHTRRCSESGKVCFRKKDAQMRKKFLEERRTRNKNKLRIYQCPDCNYFHLAKIHD